MDECYARGIWFYCEKWRQGSNRIPKIKVPIGSQWLFKSKFNYDGNIDKFKLRLVANSYSQKEGIDHDVLSHVAKMNTIRLMIALATKHNSDLHRW